MGFTHIKVEWCQSTLYLYLAIIFVSYFVAVGFKNVKLSFGKHKIDNIALFIIAIILLYFKGFGTAGRDLRAGYYINFLSAKSLSHFRDQSIEWGYKLFNVIVRNITEQYWVFVFLIGVFTLFPVFFMLKKYKSNIDVPVVILLYTSIFYFSGFSPMRISLAASIGLFAFDAMLEFNHGKAIMWIIISTLIHTSMIALMIPYCFMFGKIFTKKRIVFLILVLFVIIFVGRDDLVSWFSGSDRYYNYVLNDNVSFGLEQIAYYAPFFLVMYLARTDDEKRIQKTGLSYLLTGFCFGMIGYVISVFGRTSAVFLPIIFIGGYYVNIIKGKYPKGKHLINIIVIAYCMIRFGLYISQYYSLEDIMPYTDIFGNVI